MNRKPVFDAIKAARNGKAFSNSEVEAVDRFLDTLDVPNGELAEQHISAAGLKVIKDSEGLRLKAYRDTGGVLTVGYGHTGADVKPDTVVTEAYAEELLKRDVVTAENAVRRMFPITSQSQFDALVSFTYNLGEGQVGSSTLRKLHNADDFVGAAAQFGRWVKDNGRELPGLVKRRAAEARLYQGKAA